MTFALCLQVPNHLRFNRIQDLYTNFIPQMIFLQSIFGYLVTCILYKWSVDWSKASIQPPSLLNMIIDMFLSPGEVSPENQLYPGQATVQLVLLGLAAICVPWLLVSKPYLEWKEMHKIHGQGYVGLHNGDDAPRISGDLEGEEEGNGRAIVEAMEDNEVNFPFIGALRSFILNISIKSIFRNNTILARWLYIKLFIPSSSVSGVSHILLRIYDCGLYLLLMLNFQRFCGL